jgi:hypothetical protein
MVVVDRFTVVAVVAVQVRQVQITIPHLVNILMAVPV